MLREPTSVPSVVGWEVVGAFEGAGVGSSVVIASIGALVVGFGVATVGTFVGASVVGSFEGALEVGALEVGAGVATVGTFVGDSVVGSLEGAAVVMEDTGLSVSITDTIGIAVGESVTTVG